MSAEENNTRGEDQALTSSSLYLGNMPPDATARMLFDAIGRAGPVEALRILPDKRCAFLDFVNMADAEALMRRKTTLRGHPSAPVLTIRPAKASVTPTQVKAAIKNGATRSLYVGTELPEDSLQSFFGADKLDLVKRLPERSVAFVHFVSVVDAIDGMERFRRAHSDTKVNFCDDRSAPYAKKRIATSETDNIEAGEIAADKPQDDNIHRRTIFLGGIPADTTLQDLADVIRGGQVESLRILAGKNSSFVSFVEPGNASRFHEHASRNGLYVRGELVKNIGWGDARILPASLSMALRRGASRVVYLGNITGSAFTEDKLLEIGCQYGAVEHVKLLKDKGIAFIAFSELRDAVKAQDALSQSDEFMECRVGFGQDRCAEALPSSRPMGFYTHNSKHGSASRQQGLQSLARKHVSGRFSDL
jgi:RNA recognition motif-containing protein